MKRNVLISIMSMCAVVLLSAVVSCERRLPDVNPGGPDSPDDSSAVTPADTLESLGTYVFGADTCDIHVLRLEENESYVYLFISPLAPGGELSTYAVFGLRRYWCDGEEHDVNDVLNPLDHNDDYYFVYEDPVYFYSQYRAFQEGTVRMSVSEDWMVRLSLEVLLIDGTPFSIEISRTVPPEGSGI